MRVLVDYRPALRERTGVGEYIHQLVKAYAASHPGVVSVFTSSWKDRPAAGLDAELGTPVVDRRIPVRALNLLWHRLEWPPVDLVAGPADVVHSAHPLLMPARRAAQVVTIHDLFFLTNPSGTRAEIRRDYAALAGDHARRAHAVITSTEHGRALVADRLGVPERHVYVCRPGAPAWRALGTAPNVPVDGYVLFVGTLEPRKNVGVLLDAYERLLGRVASPPPLVVAGRAAPGSEPWLERMGRAPLAPHVRHLGYVPDGERERLYAGARVLALPSLDEGFGLTALEAMSAGVPVVASNRGSLPEVVGRAGALVDPADADALAAALLHYLADAGAATAAAQAGLARAREFTWTAAAATLHRAYADAWQRRSAA